MTIAKQKLDILAKELLGVLLLHTGELILRFPCNHADHLMFAYRDCIFSLAVFELFISACKREFHIWFWIILAAALALPHFEDRYNILVPYDTWTSRGMPNWGMSVDVRSENNVPQETVE